MVPKIAISQAPYQRDTPFCLNRALEQMRQARQMGADILVFPEWFLGLNPLEALPSRQTDALAQQARTLALAVVCGTLRTLDPRSGQRRQEALIIDMDGKMAGRQAKCDMAPAERPWFDPGESLTAISTRFGRVAILLGPDALSPGRWAECRELFPDVVFLLTGARNTREAETLRSMTLDRSREIGGTVVLAPLTGRFGGITYVPCALAAHRGRIIAAPGPEDAVGLAALATPTLIQLGAVDAAAEPLTEASDDPSREPERRVLVDWQALQASDLLGAGRRLLAAAYDSPRQTALAPVHPDHPEVLETLLAEGARGGMAWPAAVYTHAYDARYRDVVGLLARQGKPLVVRVGESPAPLRFSAPADWDDWLVQYPDWPVLFCLAGLHRPFWEEALTLAALRPNVYLLTGPLDPPRLTEALRRVGPGRLVFGTGGAKSFTAAWDVVENLRQQGQMAGDAFTQVAGGNARRLFFREWEPSLVARPEQE